MKVLILVAEDGGIEVVTDGPAEVISVCDWTPNDRLYRLTANHTVSADKVAEILGAGPVGSADDDRHEAIKNRVLSGLDGASHLKLVE